MERTFVFPKAAFCDFFDLLKGLGQVIAPVRVSAMSFSFKPVESADEIAFEALRTILPPKKLFFQPRETLIKYNETEIAECIPQVEPQVLFGVHPCDLAGLGAMDKIYGADPQDSHYMARRRKTTIVGLSCMPDKYCFCYSLGTHAPNGDYDLFLTDIGDRFFVAVRTARGLDIIDGGKDLFKPAASADKERFKQFLTAREAAFVSGFSSTALPQLMDMEWDNPIWQELGDRCLSCGNCTPVCPTCYCFDVIDVAGLQASQGERVREWDSCQLAGFAKVSGEFNFRPGPVDRLKFWYRHKLHGFEDAYGLPSCVGCGRCTVSCPSGIDDIVGVVLRLQGKEDPRAGAEGKPSSQGDSVP
ncbi:MAG TPA: 4Fe-4S dicluster domain-containing protein [Candidatus Obscuribacterales bacterium]